MKRGILVLVATAGLSALGCRPPCNPTTNVYWSFTAPGLTTPLTCAQAGIDTVSVWADGDFLGDLPCSGPHADGIQLIGYGDGNVHVQLEAWAGSAVTGTKRYTFDGSPFASGCDSSVDAVADALPGRLDLGYLLGVPSQTCLASSYVSYQLRGPAGENYDLTPTATRLACGDTPAYPTLPAGAYTLSKFEVGVAGPGTWTPDYNACAATTFVHAGDDVLTTTLAPAAGVSCWP
jgi:hypothetical protein